MKKYLIFCFTILIVLNFSSFSQIKIKSAKLPKYSVSASIGYNFVVGSANGNVYDLSILESGYSSNAFTSKNLGMQQGAGIAVTGKMSINKKRNLRLTGMIGYDHFYNTGDKGRNRTRWQIFSLYPGIEFNNGKVFASMEAGYSLVFGAWQSDVVFPDNSTSNIYVKFKPASRIGAAVGTGIVFKMNRKMNFTVGLKGVWANIFPKFNKTSSSGYELYINDSANNNGIEIGGTKEIIYLQLNTGITFSLK
ncbi:MAG: hypothetical protein N2510_03295 [Ignavibacteria bacterium]|nr:hypothetical protein [Ignavibacteria bacterium]